MISWEHLGISWEHLGISLHQVGPFESSQRKMEPQVPGRTSTLGPSSSTKRLLPTRLSLTVQARSCPRGQTGPQRGTESTLCAWGVVICPEGCGTNPTPPQCSQVSFGVGHPTGWARKPKGNKAATGPSRLSPGQRDNEMGSPHPKYCS